MDFNEKEAARSKYKASKKNQPGRGRGRGVPGWRGSSAKARQTRDLGTNADRYDSGDDLDQPSEGPVRQSEGADLAEWLDQFPPQDPLFHARQRVNLHEEVGLPPTELDTFQGLSFDLKGLAECLSKLPLHEVLKVPPPVDENGNRIIDSGEEDLGYVPKEENGGVKDIALSSLQHSKDSVAVEEPPEKAAAKLPPLPAKAARKPPGSVEVTNKLDKININAVTNDVDDELDALLGLGVAAAAPKISGVVASTGQNSKPGEEEDSLEAFLDNL